MLDWAAKFTAGMVMEETGKIWHQYDSWGKAPFAFCEETAEVAFTYGVSWVIVEDAPPGLKQFLVKPVLRAQGILMREMHAVGMLDNTRFLQPSVWQHTFEGVWRGGKDSAERAAIALGYTAPDMLSIHADEIPPLGKENSKARTKIRGQLKKSATDYNDAFLMGQWAITRDNDEIIARTQPPMI